MKNPNSKLINSTQTYLNVNNHIIKINFLVQTEKTIKIDNIKKMILNACLSSK